MKKQNCKGCIWLDICLNKTETDEACEDYFTDEEDNQLAAAAATFKD